MLLLGGLQGRPHASVEWGWGGDAGPLSSVVIKAEPGMNTKKEIGEVAGLEPVLSEMEKEKGGEMERNIQRSARTAWVSLNIIVRGQLWTTGCTLDKQKNVNMLTLGAADIET